MSGLFRSPIVLLLAASAVLCLDPSADALTLAANSKTEYSIIIPNDLSSSDPEMTAGKELQHYLRQVTGADFTIRNERAAVAGTPRILIGQTERVKRLLPDVDWASLRHDGIVIRTVGRDLVLAGGRPRGTLYAVYTFLEDTVGVRWWTSAESTIPKRSTLRIPALNTVYTPKLLYREAFYDDTNRNPLFAAKLKLNGHFTAIPETHGNHYSLLGWCHTFYALVPPNKHFAEHPEWFSEINGKRSADWAQLCLSNDEMRKDLTREALRWIRRNPNAGIISISQNDWHGACQCAKCKAVDEEEGSQAGSLIRFVNKVAEDIEKRYPEMLVETLAYQYTRKPPLKVRPRKNVVVRLCSIECNFGRPLDSDYNASFRDDMHRWSAIAPNLYIWNYVTDFAAYIQPHPNMRALAPDIRFFIENNTIGIFEQGNPGCTIGDFDRMRAWLLAHVMWDPSRDEKALMTEFMNGYYGKAGPYLQKYLDLVHDAYEKTSIHLGCYNVDVGFLTSPVMNEAYALFAHALDAVREDPTLSARVRRERLVLDHVLLRNYRPYRLAIESTEPFAGPDDLRKLGTEFLALAEKYGNRNATEGRSWESYIPGLESLFVTPPTPEELSALPKDGRMEIQETEMLLIGKENGWIDAVKDPAASDGSAARMPGGHTQWALQFHITGDVAKRLEGKWKVYAVIRCETGDNGGSIQAGIFDPAQGFIAHCTPFAAKSDEARYMTCYMGTHVLRTGMYIWIAPLGNADTVRWIHVDRFVLVPEK